MSPGDSDLNTQRVLTYLRLYGLVIVMLTLTREAECVKADSIASRLGMREDVVESLVKVLTNAGLVEVNSEGRICGPNETRNVAGALLYSLETLLTEGRLL